MSQGGLALAAGLLSGQASISRYESGHVTPTLLVAHRLATALGCSLDALMGDC